MGEQYIFSDPGHLPSLFRARRCYSSELAEHNRSEGTVFLVMADFFFCKWEKTSLLPRWSQNLRHKKWQTYICCLMRLLIDFDKAFELLLN